MARQEFSGSAVETVLASGISDSDTTFTIVDATGWPDGSVGNFVVTLDRGESTEEKVLCASRSGTMVTVAPGGRGYDGTTAHSHATGATAKHTISAAQMDVWDSHVADEDATAHAAEKISFTPAGTVAATNVQAAVEELDTGITDLKAEVADDITDFKAEVAADITDFKAEVADDITNLRAEVAVFGDASDGDVTIVGTVTLVRDMNYRTLTVPSGATLITKGFVIRASKSVTVDAGGVIHDDGEDGTDAVGFRGGNGGDSGGGGGGAGGRGAVFDTSPATGGGGGGGGVVVIATPTLVNNGTVRANGGDGGNSGSSSQGTVHDPNGTPGTGRIAGGLGFGGSPGLAVTLDFVGGGGGSQVPSIKLPAWGYTVVGTLPVGPVRIFGGAGGRDSGGGHGGVILTVTRSRSGAGTYQVAGGAAGSGASGSPGTDGHIHHISIGA